jgi:hypothetical protein
VSNLPLKCCSLALVGLLAVGSGASAQSTEFSQAILALPSSVSDNQRLINDARLFGGVIRAVITNQFGTEQDFQSSDLISFLVLPRTSMAEAPTGEGFTTPFVGTRQEFEAWARANADGLLRVFFPAGLTAGAAGRDTGVLYSQQLLLTTVLSMEESGSRDRAGIDSLVEYERITRDDRVAGDSSWALQGLYAFGRTLSLQGRFSRQQESLHTTSASLAIDYHPHIQRELAGATTVRAGALARAGFLYSRSASLDLIETDPIQFGSLDFAGGGWASVRREFARVMVGGGGLVQGTKSYVPPGDEGTFHEAFASALNDRGVQWDVTAGAMARVDVSTNTSIMAKVAETRALESAVDRPATHLLLGGVVYSLGPSASLNAGFKATWFSGALARAIFFQGNFGW